MAARLTDQDLKQFINRVSGFQENEENFGLCMKFAASNLKYHTFLDVDSIKVQRALNGVCEKFAIHSETKRANKLREISKTFLETKDFENRERGHTDTHYALLSFLLTIAERPVKADYVETKPPEVVKEVKDDFDWTGYLLDGVEISYPTLAESDLSDWSDSEDEEGEKKQTPRSNRSEEEHQQDAPPGELVYFERQDGCGIDPIAIETPNDWLKRNLVTQYWTGETDNFERGRKFVSHFHEAWQQYKTNVDPLSGNYKHTLVTEWKLIREVLWMLMGITDLYLFRFTKGKFTSRPDLAVSSLSEEVLQNFLTFFTYHGTMVVHLKEFVEQNSNRKADFCRTYQGFAQAISTALQKDLLKTLISMETVVLRQEATVTLSRLYRELHAVLQRVEIIYRIFDRGVVKGRHLGSHSQKASHLLSTLYETLIMYDTLFESDDVIEERNPYVTPIIDEPCDNTYRNTSADLLQLLLPVWLMTSEPYISIISTWISEGCLTDPKEEFVIHRDKHIGTMEQTFWEKSFHVHTLKRKDRDRDKHSRKNKEEAGEEEEDGDEDQYLTSNWAPEFLRPVLQQIVMTGKSMEMLEGLGTLAKHESCISEEIMYIKEGRLYERFLESLEEILASPASPGDMEDVTMEKEDDRLFAPDIEPYLEVQGTHCPLLKLYFQDLMSNKRTVHEETLKKLMDRVNTERLQPIQLILQDCLYPHIQMQYERVCTKLIHTLKTDFQLFEYLGAMRKFFLMEAGDTMFPFYTVIFDKIRHHEPWRDISLVTWSLQEAVDLHHPDETSRLTVSIQTPETNTPCQPINVTDCIHLRYQVPHPVDSVINERCQAVYNQIFQFLLQVKRAKYCLDQLLFSDLSSDYASHSLTDDDLLSSQIDDTRSLRSSKLHRMHLLKMKLSYFVNSFHNYIMTRILHSIGMEFTHDLAMADDLDQIIAIHAAYIRKIHQRCLLHHKAAFLKEAIMKVLNLVLTFQVKWDQGIDQLSVKKLDGIENEFSRCVHFLSSFLNNVVQRKTFPHLESLALCLQDLHMPDARHRR